MINLDDMTLEELQQLALTAANVDKKDPNAVRRLQELAGLTGKDVDGIWGPKSLNTWNESISQATDDEQRFQDAMARGQKSPAVEDILGYSNERDKKIQQLEQQIVMVKERIARNTRTLTGKSYEDINNKLAALEMKKINSQDPTSLWRWQNQRQDAMHANTSVKSNEAANFANTVDMLVNTNPSSTTEGVEQQISNIASAIKDGKNIGADVSGLYEKKKELENYISGKGIGTTTEKIKADLNTLLKSAKTSAELREFQNEYGNSLTHDQNSEINLKIKELQKKENANADEAAFKKWAVGELGRPWDKIADVAKAALRRKWKDINGGK